MSISPNTEWYLVVRTSAYVTRATYASGSARGIVAFDSISVDTAGVCLEMAFRAVPKRVNIQLHDIVQMYVREDPGDNYTAVFYGVMTQIGNPRSYDAQPYVAVGMKQRYYDRVCALTLVEGDDVADMVYALVLDADFTAVYPHLVASVPMQFEQGDLVPAFDTYGNLIDRLVASVGSFTVPTGETYSYRGVTYTVGETVPPSVWGVNAKNQAILTRPNGTPVALSESQDDVDVEWRAMSAEDTIDAVRLLFATALDLSSIASATWSDYVTPVAYDLNRLPIEPVARAYGNTNGDTARERPALVEGPLDFMTTGTVTSGGSSEWTSVSSAYDGSSATYASSTSDDNAITFSCADQTGTGIWRVRGRGTTLAAHLDILVIGVEGSFSYRHLLPMENAGEDFDVYVVAPRCAYGPATITSQAISVSLPSDSGDGGTASRIYEVEYYVPDSDVNDINASEMLAGSFMNAAPTEVASITYYGFLDAPEYVTLTTVTGADITERVERTEYVLTPDQGLLTRFHIGQAYQSQDEAYRAVIERLAKHSEGS
jgi:hypothetical protein